MAAIAVRAAEDLLMYEFRKYQEILFCAVN